jgi:hypothetical protein
LPDGGKLKILIDLSSLKRIYFFENDVNLFLLHDQIGDINTFGVLMIFTASLAVMLVANGGNNE